jgi:hypothetical protein
MTHAYSGDTANTCLQSPGAVLMVTNARMRTQVLQQLCSLSVRAGLTSLALACRAVSPATLMPALALPRLRCLMLNTDAVRARALALDARWDRHAGQAWLCQVQAEPLGPCRGAGAGCSSCRVPVSTEPVAAWHGRAPTRIQRAALVHAAARPLGLLHGVLRGA